MQQIPPYENQVVEFTSQWGEKDGQTIKKTLVAFANTFGGDLYIGVNDDGTVCGLQDIHDVEERLCSVIRDAIFPSITSFVSTARLTVEGKKVLHVHVDQGRFPPYSLVRDDLRQIFVRVGCSSSPAKIDDIAQLVERSNPTPYEERISFNQELTFETCLAYCRERGVIFHPETNTNFGFWDPLRKGWTNLAELCSDQGRAQFVLIHFLNDDKTEIIEAKKISGSIFTLLSQAVAFVASSNSAGIEKPKDGSLERINHYRVNPDAIREAIVNQLVHCDYKRNVPNTIHITPSRIDFWSAGGPHNLLPRDILENLSTSCRNMRLASFLTRLDLMEGIGTGFQLIRKIYRGTPIDRLVTITDSSVKISLPRSRLINMTDLDQRQKKVLELVMSSGSVTRKDLEALLGISAPMCSIVLRELLKKKVLQRNGAGPRTYYTLAPDMENHLSERPTSPAAPRVVSIDQ